MKKKMLAVVGVLVTLLAVALVIVLTRPEADTKALAEAAQPAVTQAPAAEATEEPVDDFTVTLVSGETFTLSDYRGKIVVVDLWATWCPPCVASMPSLQQLSEEYADQVVILGVNCGDSASAVQSFVEKYSYTFPIAVDEELDILYNHFPTSGIPYTVFIDANGALFTTHLGGGDDVYEELKETIDAALEKTPVEVVTEAN